MSHGMSQQSYAVKYAASDCQVLNCSCTSTLLCCIDSPTRRQGRCRKHTSEFHMCARTPRPLQKWESCVQRCLYMRPHLPLSRFLEIITRIASLELCMPGRFTLFQFCVAITL